MPGTALGSTVGIGRVGALAVALGIGGALAAIPWTASADDAQQAGVRQSAASGSGLRTHAAPASAAPRTVAKGIAKPPPTDAPQALRLPPPPRPPSGSAPPAPPSAQRPPAPPGRPTPPSPPTPPTVSYRSIDGTGNNAATPGINATGADYVRIGVAHFSDSVSALRTDLPNARMVSNIVVAGNAETPNTEGLSGMMYAWGQFIDHDINLTNSDGVNHIDITVPAGDSTLSGSIAMTRAVIDPQTGTSGTPATATNNVTGWLDGSMVYGSDATTAASLRGAGGHLLTSAGNNLPITDGAFVAGDSRVAENPDLTALQTLFVREHNRQVDLLKSGHPDWTDEQLYQQARAIVTAEIAHITYSEFLPHLLGTSAITPYQGYKPNTDARISEEFAGAAYRLGHSIVSANLEKTDEQGNAIGTPVTLKDAFFESPSAFAADGGADGLLRHLSNDPSNALDVHIVDDLRNFLFGPTSGLDLAAINIQRGRDLGLGTLNETRSAMGLTPYTSFSQITSDTATAAALQSAYGDVNKVDLWVGGLAEDHVAGAMVGQTFDLIIAKQFLSLRDGDRFWYQNQGFDPATLKAIDSTTLSSLILRNTDTKYMQSDAFVYYERRSGQAGGGVMENPTSPQLVVGSSGADTLVGGTVNDMLVAGTGRQTLTGAAGADTFIIPVTGVNAVITDFKVGQDRLRFENLGKAALVITVENGNAVVNLGGSKVTLVGVKASAIKACDITAG